MGNMGKGEAAALGGPGRNLVASSRHLAGMPLRRGRMAAILTTENITERSEGLRIILEEDPAWEEVEVTIRCKEVTPQVAGLVASLRRFDHRLTGEREGKTYLLEAGELLYIESVEKRTFLYTQDGVFETPLRLYELEERLAPWDFVRVSKAMIVNFGKTQSISPDFAGRLQLTLENGEKVGVSRKYAPAIKGKLGLL